MPTNSGMTLRYSEGTPYAAYHVAHTKTQGGEAYEERNLVVLSRREILGQEQYMNRFCPAPLYKRVTADPEPAEPEPIGWERPILHVRIGLEGDNTLHIFNVHLKSKAPTDIVGQNKDVPDPKPPPFAWRTAYSWAEGFFVSSMKRVGQALEARIIVDKLFDQDSSALIVVCGDFNADSDDVPVQAIRSDLENTGNPALSRRVLVPCEQSIPESARYSYLYHGKGEMIDHLLVSRTLLEFYGVRRSTTSCSPMSRLPSLWTRSTLRAITPRRWPTSTCHSWGHHLLVGHERTVHRVAVAVIGVDRGERGREQHRPIR